MEKRIDFFLLSIFFTFLILGFLTLASASIPFSLKKIGNPYYFLFHQTLFGLLPGVFLAFLIFKIETKTFKKYSFIFLTLSLVLLILTLIPGIGIKIRGGTRWVKIGPLSFQPSEFVKLTFLIYLAAWLESKIEKSKEKEFKQTFAAFLIILGFISLILFFQPDISTLSIILFSSLVMFFLAKTPAWQTLVLILICTSLFFFIIKSASYRISRILVFLNPETDPLGIGYQLRQSLIAIGSGKIFGKGLGFSEQKFGVLPQSFSDSIFSVFAEETGFLGSLFLISLYLLFFLRGFKIGKEAKNPFDRFLAFGISFWIFFQAFFHIGANCGVMPFSGIPLPFLSYGGSHLIAEILATTILLRISKK